MRLDQCRGELWVLTANQNVVAHQVLFPVVLMKAAGLGVVDEVVFYRDPHTTFVQI